MNGLEISRKFYFDVVQPALRRQLPQMTGHYSAGLAGEGSDCLGFDDERSRDHDWGPGVCIWVDDDVTPEEIDALRRVIAALPKTYMGFPTRLNTPRTGVFTAAQFYVPLLRMAGAPETNVQWLSIPEPSMASATSGEVFEDNGGSFSQIRAKLLAYCPEDVRLYRMAAQAAIAAQTGQYNYLRCLERGDTVAAQVIKGRFTESSAALIFLLNRRYRPFYKWAYRTMQDLPILGSEAYGSMSALAEKNGREAFMEMEKLSGLIIAQLQNQGLTDSKSDFLMDHVPQLLMKIQDKDLQRRPLSLVF